MVSWSFRTLTTKLSCCYLSASVAGTKNMNKSIIQQNGDVRQPLCSNDLLAAALSRILCYCEKPLPEQVWLNAKVSAKDYRNARSLLNNQIVNIENNILSNTAGRP